MIPSREGEGVASLNRQQMEMLKSLRERESEVRSHEQAHIASGGRYVQGGASYTHRMGPDGRMYAVGGEVSIDTSPVPGDPEATAEKARQIRRAALAPSNPSAQDLRTAAEASRMEARAKAEVRRQEMATEGLAANSQSGKEADKPGGASGSPVSKGSQGRSGSQVLHTPLHFAQQAYQRQSIPDDYFVPSPGQRINRMI